jgi:hypothetical protein
MSLYQRLWVWRKFVVVGDKGKREAFVDMLAARIRRISLPSQQG